MGKHFSTMFESHGRQLACVAGGIVGFSAHKQAAKPRVAWGGGAAASPPQATRGCAARCRGFAAFACARETQQYRQLRRLGGNRNLSICPVEAFRRKHAHNAFVTGH